MSMGHNIFRKMEAASALLPDGTALNLSNVSPTFEDITADDLTVDAISAGAQTVDGVLVDSPTGSIGFTTGAGGTVTQGAGSGKATSVTLSKPCGLITTDPASLAAGAAVTFTVINTQCSALDHPAVSLRSQGASYSVMVATVSSGNFSIKLTNTTAGALAEAVAIGFVIIKGSVS